MDELAKTFRAVNVLATFLSSRSDAQVNAVKLLASASTQLGRVVTIEDLARIKYLMPDDVILEYQDTPYDAVIGQAPSEILVFQFVEKARSKFTPTEKVLLRQQRFDLARQRLSAKRTWEEIVHGASNCMPRQKTPSGTTKVSLENFMAQVKHEATRTIAAREPRWGDTPEKYEQLVKEFGIDRLYSHQVQGLEHVDRGEHVVVTTSTASGKSLIFQLPIVYELTHTENSTMMYMSPTKALAQDQMRAMGKYTTSTLATFDGDTEWKDRQGVIDNARLIFCNPDILHCTVLPRWHSWQRILSNLKFVVLDEIHCYSGTFGAHTSLVLRRLRRICHQLGNDSLQFIACSATIDQPARHLGLMTGILRGIHHVWDDGSPSGAKHYLFVQTSNLIEGDKNSGRVHPMVEATPVLVQLASCELRGIAFCRVRRVCELLMRSVREKLKEEERYDLEPYIMSYRGGYSAQNRREIERKMFKGELRGIIATSALEVGIDIGNLDVVLVVGFPHSLSSFRQQVGRAGRRSKDSLVIYIADGSVLDANYIKYPDRIFTDPYPQLPLPLDAPIILTHLQCAAYELAMSEEDGSYFPNWDDLKEELDFENELYHYNMAIPDPARTVSLRKGQEAVTLVIDVTNGKHEILEEIEFSRVGFTVYEGAIFHYQGKPYLVIRLEADLGYAHVQRTRVTWTTRQRDLTDLNPLSTQTSMLIGDMKACLGPLQVKVVVFGYFKVDRRNKIIDAVELNMDPFVSTRAGFWINISLAVLDQLTAKKLNAAGAIHAANHAILGVLPKFVTASPQDLGTECKAPLKELAKKGSSRVRPARLTFYERNGGERGNGIVKNMYENIVEMLIAACEAVDGCGCHHGCSDCVAWPSCPEQNVVLSKFGAQVILRGLVNKPIDNVPDGPEPNFDATDIVTVVPVQAGTGV